MIFKIQSKTHKRLFHLACISLLAGFSHVGQAAMIKEIWGAPSQYSEVNQFYFDNQTLDPNSKTANTFLFQSQNLNANTMQQFRALRAVEVNGVSTVRYGQYYRGLSVWGQVLMVHHKNRSKLTGEVLLGIEKDIKTITPTLSANEAVLIAKRRFMEQHAKDKLTASYNEKQRLGIYFDRPNLQSEYGTARLVYIISFYTNNLTSKRLLEPVFILDAHNGKTYLQYDNVQTRNANIGTGPGGNDITGLGYRTTNHYQFGNAITGLPSLGFLYVSINNTTCMTESPQIRVISWNNQPSTNSSFPVLYSQEASHPVFQYTCTFNGTDNGQSPVINNGFSAYSPINDAYYFAQKDFEMIRIYLPGFSLPWGPLMPVRVYTHIADLDNAFAISPYEPVDEPTSFTAPAFNPQVVLGNGETSFYPQTDSGTLGHELAHIFTAFYSHLIYNNQSGAINEAYSDINDAVLNNYLREQFPWYGFSWDIGSSTVLPSGPYGGKALRYMVHPPMDGHSISNAANFVPGMDVHFSSGVFNRAFYLIISKGISFVTGYRYFSLANIKYWTPSTGYDFASCGVLQVAIDEHNLLDYRKIMAAFSEVGVKCKIGEQQLNYQA